MVYACTISLDILFFNILYWSCILFLSFLKKIFFPKCVPACTFRLQGTGFGLLIGFVCGMLLLAIFIICSVSYVLNVFMLLYMFIT